MSSQDPWAQWLLHRRHGGDLKKYKSMIQQLATIRDKVLESARLQPGETLLDVGCGDGLIAFGALSQMGEQGHVIFSDISQDLLNHCQGLAQQMSVEGRCQFINAPATDLHIIADHTIDAVTTRSVLIYVAEKQLAFNEFYRVLKPGGRLSIFEPINRLSYPEPPDRFFGYDVTPIISLIQKWRGAQWDEYSSQYDPMMNFGEQDLVEYAEKAGFTEIHLTLNMDIAPNLSEHGSDSKEKPSWDTFLKTSPNPLAPTIAEMMQARLTHEEVAQFTEYLRPLVEADQRISRFAVAYLQAVKHTV